ncbi:hypothetical protein HPB48_017828 [Haemaphysalis longicornis]|uniref:Uncharacterized protein n=1 Tax=Haemaphysalis longicornis TaxID=44386 RepID=A0A9J6GDP1_HAELO|nr:hypothetical protein HPB48_017828 [Haemaphysalis longicornis]
MGAFFETETETVLRHFLREWWSAGCAEREIGVGNGVAEARREGQLGSSPAREPAAVAGLGEQKVTRRQRNDDVDAGEQAPTQRSSGHRRWTPLARHGGHCSCGGIDGPEPTDHRCGVVDAPASAARRILGGLFLNTDSPERRRLPTRWISSRSRTFTSAVGPSRPWLRTSDSVLTSCNFARGTRFKKPLIISTVSFS